MNQWQDCRRRSCVWISASTDENNCNGTKFKKKQLCLSQFGCSPEDHFWRWSFFIIWATSDTKPRSRLVGIAHGMYYELCFDVRNDTDNNWFGLTKNLFGIIRNLSVKFPINPHPFHFGKLAIMRCTAMLVLIRCVRTLAWDEHEWEHSNLHRYIKTLHLAGSNSSFALLIVVTETR